MKNKEFNLKEISKRIRHIGKDLDRQQEKRFYNIEKRIDKIEVKLNIKKHVKEKWASHRRISQ